MAPRRAVWLALARSWRGVLGDPQFSGLLDTPPDLGARSTCRSAARPVTRRQLLSAGVQTPRPLITAWSAGCTDPPWRLRRRPPPAVTARPGDGRRPRLRPGAALSHRSAAASGDHSAPARPLDVTARSDQPAPRHQHPPLANPHPGRHHPPVRHRRSPPRPHPAGPGTVLPSHSLTRAVNEARIRNLLSDGDHAHRPDPLPSRTSSSLHDNYDLPRPEVNQQSPATRSTCSGETSDLIAELHGRTYHGAHLRGGPRTRRAPAREGCAPSAITKRRLTGRPAGGEPRCGRLLSGEGGIRTLGRG